jgi:hypothetical protein
MSLKSGFDTMKALFWLPAAIALVLVLLFANQTQFTSAIALAIAKVDSSKGTNNAPDYGAVGRLVTKEDFGFFALGPGVDVAAVPETIDTQNDAFKIEFSNVSGVECRAMADRLYAHFSGRPSAKVEVNGQPVERQKAAEECGTVLSFSNRVAVTAQ